MADDVKPSQFSFLNFGNQDLPAFVEVKGKDWIYYGEKNDYPYYLVDLYTQSAYHKAIVDGKVSYICGNGWGVDTTGLSLSQKADALRMLDQPFAGLDLNDATRRWVQDAEIFNGFCIVVNWEKGKKGATLEYIDMANIRTNADESEFYYTRGWYKKSKDGTRKENNKAKDEKDFTIYPAYDPENRKGKQIYYWKGYHPDQAVYPIPVYAGAVTWINVNVDLAKYFYNTVNTAFVATHLINFNNGEPTEEAKRDIEAKIEKKWTSPTGKRIITSFNQSKESATTVETLQMTDADKQYDAVWKYSEQSIFTGHSIPSPMLFGIKTEGQLGGRTEVIENEERFQNSYVRHRQHIVESVINELARDFGIQTKFYLNKVSVIGYMFSDSAIEGVLTPEEKRTAILAKLGIKPTESVDSETSGAKLLKTLNSISPLVANKVLESLNLAEIRAMIGLNANGTFSKQEPDDTDLIQVFSSISHEGKYKVLYERPVEVFDKEGIEKSEMEFMSQHFAAEIKANALERSIIDLLSKDSTLQPEALAAATKSTTEKVTAAIQRLVERKILSPSPEAANGDKMKGWEVSEKGLQALDEKPAKTAKTAVVYRYGLAPRFKDQDEIIPGSRKFCREMIALSKSGKRWKSEAIFSLDPGDGINPWLQRGGWYTRPDGSHVPQCRHSWHQELVEVIE